MNSKNQQKKKEIDWMITLVPLALIVALCIVFFFAPEQSNQVLGQIRFLFGDTFGTYYLVIGLGIFFLSLFLAGSKYGNIVLGKPDEKPKYSFFAWGCMMFTCGLAADILFYSFSEWILYATDPHIAELGSIQDWAGVFPLFHWSFIPWGFYLVLAVAFGFMLHVRKRNRQKYSEACRPILGKQTDGIGGRLIDLLAVFALLAGTATTFSVATPLMAEIIGELFHMEVSRTVINIIILLITCCVYTYSLLHGFKGISILAKVCIYLFFGLLAFVLLFGGETRYIIETGFSSLGKMIQNFIGLSTYTDPMRTTNFPQNWTIYYWAYWMVWCVAAPFFIGSISRGRTVRQTILGGYGFGVGSTLVSFIILGNYSMGKQISGAIDFISQYNENGDLYHLIVSMIKTMPCAPLIMVVVLVTMVAFYAREHIPVAVQAGHHPFALALQGLGHAGQGHPVGNLGAVGHRGHYAGVGGILHIVLGAQVGIGIAPEHVLSQAGPLGEGRPPGMYVPAHGLGRRGRGDSQGQRQTQGRPPPDPLFHTCPPNIVCETGHTKLC